MIISSKIKAHEKLMARWERERMARIAGAIALFIGGVVGICYTIFAVVSW